MVLSHSHFVPCLNETFTCLIYMKICEGHFEVALINSCGMISSESETIARVGFGSYIKLDSELLTPCVRIAEGYYQPIGIDMKVHLI